MGLRIQGRAVEARLLQKWCTLQAGFVRSRYLNQAGDVLGSAKKTGQEVMFQGSGFRVQDSRFRVTPAGGAQDGWGSRKTGGLCGVWKHNCQSTRVKQSENTGERLYQSRSGLKKKEAGKLVSTKFAGKKSFDCRCAKEPSLPISIET